MLESGTKQISKHRVKTYSFDCFVYRLVIFPMYGNNTFEISDFADQRFSL